MKSPTSVAWNQEREGISIPTLWHFAYCKTRSATEGNNISAKLKANVKQQLLETVEWDVFVGDVWILSLWICLLMWNWNYRTEWILQKWVPKRPNQSPSRWRWKADISFSIPAMRHYTNLFWVSVFICFKYFSCSRTEKWSQLISKESRLWVYDNTGFRSTKFVSLKLYFF